MKTRMPRWLARVALLLVAIAAWGTGATAQSLSGEYGGEGCSFKLTFRAKDVVYIQFIAGGEVQTEMPGQYKVDGDKVAVTAPSWGLVFTRKGDALEARYLGGPEVCTRLSDVGSARQTAMESPIQSPTFATVQGVWTLDYQRVVTQEGISQVYDTRSLPTCSASVQRWCVARHVYYVFDTTNRGQWSVAAVPPSDPSYTPQLMGSAAVARDSLILGAGEGWPGPRTFSLQVSSSRMHLTRHWTLGAVDAQKYKFSLPPGGSLKGTLEWWLQRGLTPQVARAPVAGPCDQFSPAYNTDNICFDTRPIPLTQTSEAKGRPNKGGRGMMWRPDQAQGAITLPMPADASVVPSPTLLLLNVQANGRTIEAPRVLFESNVRTFTDAAVNMAQNLRWHPALKHGEPVEAWVPWEFQAVAAGASGFISVNVTGWRNPRRTSVVWIDNVPVGRTPLITYQVRAGRHTIMVQVGNRLVNDTVQVDSGATVVKSYDAAQR